MVRLVTGQLLLSDLAVKNLLKQSLYLFLRTIETSSLFLVRNLIGQFLFFQYCGWVAILVATGN
jgi:hypothetical protein